MSQDFKLWFPRRRDKNSNKRSPYVIQIGAFSSLKNANRLKLQANQIGHDVQIVQVETKDRTLNDAISKFPNEAVFHYSLGKVHYARKEYEKAIAAFQLAVNLRSGDAEMHKNLAVSYKKVGNYIEAVKWYKSSLELKPDNPRLLFLLAHTQMQNFSFQNPYQSHLIKNLHYFLITQT